MVQCMMTGGGYANNRKCSDYFTDSATNYVAARAMVNGSDKARAISTLADASARGAAAMMSAVIARHQRAFRWSMVAFCTLARLSGAVSASPVAPSKIVGDWEVTRLLVTDGFSNSQRSMKPDDANLTRRKFSFQMNPVTSNHEETRCKLDTSLAKRVYPIKTLFAEERLARPKIIRDRFYRRAAQYALGPLAQLDAYVAKRNTCEGPLACVYSVLDEHASILAKSISSVQQCTELKAKKYGIQKLQISCFWRYWLAHCVVAPRLCG